MPRQKRYLFILILSSATFSSPSAFADWSLSGLFLNRIPLEAKEKKEIQQFFLGKIRVAKTGLSCFPKANNKQRALHCAQLMDRKMDLEMKALDAKNPKASAVKAPNYNAMQDSVTKTDWNNKEKKVVLDEIKLNLNNHQTSYNCIGKAKTMGDLKRCFERR